MNEMSELYERLTIAADLIAPLQSDFIKHLNDALILEKEEFFDGFRLYLRAQKDFPFLLRVKAKHIAHELRSILDALACTLALHNDYDEEGVYFPISQTADKFERALRKCVKFTEQQRTKLAQLELYNGGHPNLYILHDIDRLDKHRAKLLPYSAGNQVVVGGRSYPIMNAGKPVILRNCTFDGVSVKSLTIYHKSARPKSRSLILEVQGATGDVRPFFDVYYSGPASAAGMPVIETLNGFNATVKDVLDRFEVEFQ